MSVRPSILTTPDRYVTTPDGAPAGKADVRFLTWFFPVWYFVFGVIICVLARATPPPRPDVQTAGKVSFFLDNELTIQIGFVVLLMILGGAPLTNGLVAYHMKRMSVGSVFAYAYIGSMGVGALPGFLLIAVCFLTAIYRPDRDPELIGWLYDQAYLSYNGSLGCFTAAYIVLAIAILYDKNDIFPKWFSYVTIWQVITEVIATQFFLFYSGPFSWNGVFGLWWAVVVFSVWLGALIWVLRQAAVREPVDSPGLD